MMTMMTMMMMMLMMMMMMMRKHLPLLGGHAGCAGAVEVDVLPLALATVPDAGLLGLHGARHAAAVHVLGQADVGDARRVLANQVHVGVQQDGVHRLVAFRQSWGGIQL